MTLLQRQLAVAVLLFFLGCAPAFSAAPGTSDNACLDMLALSKERDAELARDLRRLHRELAALRMELEQPGVEEVFSGIGYILGLFGIGFYVAGRRRRQE